MRHHKDIVGKKFGLLTVIEEIRDCTPPKVICLCDCGKTKIAIKSNVNNGCTKSCGCLRITNANARNASHNKSKTPIHNIWRLMKSRCCNPKNPAFKYYGGRGISICDEWVNNSIAFMDWALKNGYKSGLEIDRKENNGHYEPSNCRFVNHKINIRNTRKNIFYLYKGENKSLGEWCELFSIKYGSIYYRLKNGWEFKKALETPYQTYKK